MGKNAWVLLFVGILFAVGGQLIFWAEPEPMSARKGAPASHSRHLLSKANMSAHSLSVSALKTTWRP